MKAIALIVISFSAFSLSAFSISSFAETQEWTSRERVVEAATAMQEKTLNFHESMDPSNVRDKVLMLSDACEAFADVVASGINYEQALKEFEKFGGIYHHVDRAVADAYNLNFPIMIRWRGVEWAWEKVSWNMYGTVP